MIEEAKRYGELGLCVFPVKGKVPSIKGWKEAASSDPAKIAELFKTVHTGIGLSTGRTSGVTVIDIDVKNGLNGFETLKQIGIDLPETVVVNTPSGGKQYYFKYNPLVKNKVSAIREKSGIDIRNDGGLVIMPPSNYPSGGVYEFLIGQGVGEIELAEMPIELLENIIDKDNISFILPNIIEDGARNDTLFRYASQLRANGMEKAEIMTAIYAINKERCKPPYEQEKLETIADSACKYKKGKRPIPAEEAIFSDTYNAKVFYELMGNKIRWCRDLGGWFIYDGKRWDKDNNETIKKYAMVAAEEIAERMRLEGRKATSNLRKVHSDQGINSMINCSKALFGESVDNFDKDKQLFNCLNGTYDLSRNIFNEFNPADLLTKRANVNYDLHAVAPRWVQFLNEIFLEDQDLISYIQRVIGYSMTAFTKEHCMFILYGQGRNGKNIFTEAISGVMGDYALNCPSSMFVQKQNPGIPNDVARLKGARFVSASETNHNVNMDEELIKQLTGNKIITARFLNREYFDFEATFKIFLATNHKPNIRGVDGGIWSRIQMIPFNMIITPDKDDKNLAEKLAAEYSGILNWMIEGYNKWLKEGINVPKAVKDSTQLYREEEDDLGQFIKDQCVIVKGGFIPSQEFRERFKLINGYPKGTKALSEYMTRHGFKTSDDQRVYINNRQQRGYVGIRWATAQDQTENLGYTE